MIVVIEVVVENIMEGGRGNHHCTYCNIDGHTRDRCFSLHVYPNKTVNAVKSCIQCESKDDLETTIYGNEYKEYLQLEATQDGTSCATIAYIDIYMVRLSHSTPLG